MDTKGEVGTAEDKRLRYLTILLWAAATDLSPCQRLRLAPAQLFFFFFFFKATFIHLVDVALARSFKYLYDS
jgi:hypothetical protein